MGHISRSAVADADGLLPLQPMDIPSNLSYPDYELNEFYHKFHGLCGLCREAFW
ncbi:hypothetical protein SK128_002752, partial [Halocaridina rubra]